MPEPTEFHLRQLDAVNQLSAEDAAQLQALVEATEGRRCRDVDPETFFPPDGTRFFRQQLAAERQRVEQLCRDCPVRIECLAAALLRGENYGSWGGITQPDFQVLARLWRGRGSEQFDTAGDTLGESGVA